MNNDLPQTPLRVLFASSAALSIDGSGELAEFTTAQTNTLGALGHDVRLVLPATPDTKKTLIDSAPVARFKLPGVSLPAQINASKSEQGIPVYTIELQGIFEQMTRDAKRSEHPDSTDDGLRFGLFSRAVSLIAVNLAGLNWQPDVLHCAGWQSGLAIPLIASEWNRPATVYSLHQTSDLTLDNEQIAALNLPVELLKSGVLAIDGSFSFEKGAMATADRMMVPSPGFRDELVSEAIDHPLSPVSRSRADRLEGVEPGIDYQHWGPTTDPLVDQHFDSASFELKQLNRERLLTSLALPIEPDTLLIGYVPMSPFRQELEQLKAILQQINRYPRLHIVVSYNGDSGTETRIRSLCETHAGRITLAGSNNEALNHRVIASCDCLLLPAPQYLTAHPALVALSYGTIPIVNATGAMREALTDATPSNLLNGVANGFLFKDDSQKQIDDALSRVTQFHAKPKIWWQKLAQQGMQQSFPASQATPHLIRLYQQAIDNPAENLITE